MATPAAKRQFSRPGSVSLIQIYGRRRQVRKTADARRCSPCRLRIWRLQERYGITEVPRVDVNHRNFLKVEHLVAGIAELMFAGIIPFGHAGRVTGTAQIALQRQAVDATFRSFPGLLGSPSASPSALHLRVRRHYTEIQK